MTVSIKRIEEVEQFIEKNMLAKGYEKITRAQLMRVLNNHKLVDRSHAQMTFQYLEARGIIEVEGDIVKLIPKEDRINEFG